jgi:hypothetical protein
VKRIPKKRWLWLCLALLAIAALFVFPGSRWRIIGWVRGEPFYAGQPVSYWRAQAKNCDQLCLAENLYFYFQATSEIQELRRAWVSRNDWDLDHPLLRGDPKALSVLLQLLDESDDESWEVRLIAIYSLAKIGPEAKPAVAAIEKEFSRPYDNTLRSAAYSALSKIDPEAAARAKAANPALHHLF